MNKLAVAIFTVLILATSSSVFAEEQSRRGEPADQEDVLPRDSQEDLPDRSNNKPPAVHSSSESDATQTKKSTYRVWENNGFLEDSHLSHSFRNQYAQRDFKHAAKSGFNRSPDWKQWGQGLTIDYTSGYGFGFIGVDASFYGALRLDGSNPQNAPDELLHTERNNTRYSTTYSRIGRLNAKFRLGDQPNNVVLRYGLIGVNTALVADSDSRLLESSYRGGSFDASIDALNDIRLYGFYLDRIALRAGNSYDKLVSQSGKHIDNIQVFGAGYTFDGLGGPNDFLYFNGEYGISKNYTKQYFGQATYQIAFSGVHSMLANIQYRQAERAGNLWNPGLDGFDDRAHNINTNLMGTIDNIKVSASYSRTQAKNNNQQGNSSHQFRPELAGNDYGKGTYWTARQISSFNYDGENAYQLMAGYDFAGIGVQGLSAGLTHTYGDNINRAVGLKNEQETDLEIEYIFPQSALKGLSLKLEHAWYVSRNISGSTIARGIRLTDLRVYAHYNLVVF